MEKMNTVESSAAGVAKGNGHGESMALHGHYDIVCVGADGEVKWTDTIENLVVNVGKADLLDKYLAGSTYTAAWYLGLVDGGSAPTYNAADTLASHATWTENTSAYTQSNRWTVAWNAATGTGGGAGSAGTGSKSTTATAVAISGTATIAGCLLTVTQAKATTTGVLLSAGSFTGGNRSVISGDTLNITFTLTC